MNRSVTLIILLFLSGCVTSPIPEAYKGPVSIVKDTMESVTDKKVYFFQLSSVNGRSIETSELKTLNANEGRGFSMTTQVAFRKVPAQELVVEIEGTTHYAAPILAILGENLSVSGTVKFTPQPNKIYFVKGKLSKKHSSVWIQEKNGGIVSKVIEKKE